MSVITHAPTAPSVLAALRSPRMLTREVLAGIVTALALIPEAISFSVVAGVDPAVGLFSSVVIAIVISIVGGRPAMISAAAGSVALVIAPLVREHGIEYLVPAIVLGGVFQLVLGFLGVARLMRFIPRSVNVAFVNALAILIFTAQLPNLLGDDVPFVVWPLTVLGIAIIVGFPFLTKAIPAPLIAVVVVTGLTMVFSIAVPTVGDEGALPTALPGFGGITTPFTFETLQIIAPFAFGVAIVGLIETLLTAQLVDSITETGSSKWRESWGQGVANIASAFFGGTGGCAMIGQTVINVKTAGARTRVSTFAAGVSVLVLTIVLHDLVAQIPMAALTAVMLMVCVATFDWHSIRPRTLRRMPLGETAVMLVTVVVVVVTENLATGVLVGVVVAALVFARRVAHVVSVVREPVDDRTVRYRVRGALFFASSNDLVTRFSYAEDPERVIIDLADAHVFDASTVAALDGVEQRFAKHGSTVEVVNLDTGSIALHGRLSGELGG
ncbi:SulP family inorganic anion transporter [Curtobacterium flaccumfaciens]|uniref:SulP family inorganic anion transporter n=1 Tax=Curtobacterium flaccumfaciens TaxID=2035 RepID=UPI001BE0FF37|nr:SulP family inorganic anion transporter [Curtobacterium flaccumfaciens]MBT1585508.1 SulP family inorganic anion transporter [Curtobacterium flaccumfaciens pv. flaccumfaciens]MCX2798872.1 SulP family inorganic anion transporter [Curtobacterium flaccumfaciens pv. flaccumfaciens]